MIIPPYLKGLPLGGTTSSGGAGITLEQLNNALTSQDNRLIASIKENANDNILTEAFRDDNQIRNITITNLHSSLNGTYELFTGSVPNPNLGQIFGIGNTFIINTNFPIWKKGNDYILAYNIHEDIPLRWFIGDITGASHFAIEGSNPASLSFPALKDSTRVLRVYDSRTDSTPTNNTNFGVDFKLLTHLDDISSIAERLSQVLDLVPLEGNLINDITNIEASPFVKGDGVLDFNPTNGVNVASFRINLLNNPPINSIHLLQMSITPITNGVGNYRIIAVYTFTRRGLGNGTKSVTLDFSIANTNSLSKYFPIIELEGAVRLVNVHFTITKTSGNFGGTEIDIDAIQTLHFPSYLYRLNTRFKNSNEELENAVKKIVDQEQLKTSIPFNLLPVNRASIDQLQGIANDDIEVTSDGRIDITPMSNVNSVRFNINYSPVRLDIREVNYIFLVIEGDVTTLNISMELIFKPTSTHSVETSTPVTIQASVITDKSYFVFPVSFVDSIYSFDGLRVTLSTVDSSNFGNKEYEISTLMTKHSDKLYYNIESVGKLTQSEFNTRLNDYNDKDSYKATVNNTPVINAVNNLKQEILGVGLGDMPIGEQLVKIREQLNSVISISSEVLDN